MVFRPVHRLLHLLLLAGSLSLQPDLMSISAPVAYAAEEPLRIVILPFENLTNKPEDQWLGNSFAESLTMGLLKVNALQVVERGQLNTLLKEQQFSQSGRVDERTAPQLGKMLGARVVVIGSYQKVGNQLQANVRFVNAETGQIDPQRFARIQGHFDQIFDLQNELAEKLISQLNVSVQPAEKQQIQQSLKATDSTEAYRYYLKGVELLRKRNSTEYDEAQQAFEAALKVDPDYALAHAGLADVYASKFELRKQMRVLPSSQDSSVSEETLSKQHAARALALDPNLPAPYRALAKLEWAAGNKTQAYQQLRLSISKNPRDTDSLVEYVTFKFSEQGLKLSPAALSKELTDMGANLQDPWLQLPLAATGVSSEATRPPKQRDFSWTKELLSQAASKLPENPRIPILQMTIAKLEGDSETEKRFYDQAFKLSQQNPLMLTTLANFKLAQQDTQEAYRLIQEAYRLAPQDINVAMIRANILYTLGHKQEAESIYDQLEAQTDQNALIPFLRGVNYFGDQDFAKARPYLEQALERLKLSSESLMSKNTIIFFLGFCYLQQEAWDQALPLFQALREDPLFYGMAYDFLAQIYHLKQQHAQALEAYVAYLTIHPEVKDEADVVLKYRLYYLMDLHQREPGNLNALLDLGQVLTELERYQSAYNFLTKALKIAPNHPGLYSRLGYLEMLMEKWYEAQSSLELALKAQPNDVKSWFNLGLVRQHLGNKTGAREAFETVLRLEPSHLKAQELLKSL